LLFDVDKIESLKFRKRSNEGRAYPLKLGRMLQTKEGESLLKSRLIRVDQPAHRLLYPPACLLGVMLPVRNQARGKQVCFVLERCERPAEPSELKVGYLLDTAETHRDLVLRVNVHK
jgi:hypothetical protein